MAAPAECLLASTLWTSNLGVRQPPDASSTSNSLATNCPKIDKALDGGLNYGSINCISGEDNAGAREIGQALLISQLLHSPTATATVIDTGSAVDVRRLYQALNTHATNDAAPTDEAMKALERVKIMKVFDFVGLTECLPELRDDLEGKDVSNPTATAAPNEAPRGTVGDSEDEGEDEILDNPTPQPNGTSPKHQPRQQAEQTLLIIDNIAQVVSPLLKTNYVQGQAVLGSFMRSLAHLTKAHRICTLLINGVTSTPNVKDEAPSIFSSCKLQPALGRAFTYTLDMHLLVHRIPRASGRGDGDGNADEVSVIEVLHDRYGDRAGKWAAFVADESGNLNDLS